MRHEDTEEQLLFDLPLDTGARRPEPRRAPARRPEAAPAPVQTTAPLFEAEPEAAEEDDRFEPAEASDGRVGLISRLAAGAADLLVHGAVLMLLLIGTRFLGVRPTLDDAPAFIVFLLAFSFLYTIVPLAFWGHTLGMAWAGLVSQNQDGEPLTFDQTARRWLGGVLTIAIVGLPLLIALGGRSLADLISGSETWSERNLAAAAAEPEAAA